MDLRPGHAGDAEADRSGGQGMVQFFFPEGVSELIDDADPVSEAFQRRSNVQKRQWEVPPVIQMPTMHSPWAKQHHVNFVRIPYRHPSSPFIQLEPNSIWT
jgi:hypothetical protein